MELARSNCRGSRVARALAQYSKPKRNKNFACSETTSNNQFYTKFKKSSSFSDEVAWLTP